MKPTSDLILQAIGDSPRGRRATDVPESSDLLSLVSAIALGVAAGAIGVLILIDHVL